LKILISAKQQVFKTRIFNKDTVTASRASRNNLIFRAESLKILGNGTGCSFFGQALEDSGLLHAGVLLVEVVVLVKVLVVNLE
jgi:hypothetical protein